MFVQDATRNADAVVLDCRNNTRDMRAVVVVVGFERVDTVRRVVAYGVVPVVEIPTLDIVNKAIVVIVNAIPRNLPRIDPDVRGKVGVLCVNPRVNDRHHNLAGRRKEGRIKLPCFQDIHIDILGT